MSDYLPDWYRARPRYGWTSSRGLEQLRSIITPLTPFTPDSEQYRLSAQVMDGKPLLVIRATGSGKTMLVIIPLLARPDTSALIIAPLNALESDLKRRFNDFGISTVIINRETLREAATQGRNLWVEARTARALLMGPEQLPTDDFEDLISHPTFRARIALGVTEEVHVIDLWSDEFRQAYKLIRTLRARLPPWVTFFGLTATCRPGLQELSVINGMGFQPNEITAYRGDCERHDLHLVIRPILYGISGWSFGDLDWLIPESATSDFLLTEKTLVYCNSIKLGHRITRYLRSLLPPELLPFQLQLIKHTHSLCCEECKKEALDALCDAVGAVPCAIEVATDVIGFGVDAQRVQRVVCFDVPDELNTLVQRLGRAGRDELAEGATAYVYLKRSTMETAVASELIGDNLPEMYVKVPTELHNTVLDPDEWKAQKSEHQGAHAQAIWRLLLGLRQASTTRKQVVDRLSRTRAMLAIVQASMLTYCIVLRLNQLYGNPGTTDCGRCSVCVPDTLPKPRSPEILLSDDDGDENRGAVLVNATNTLARPRTRACMRKELVQQARAEIDGWARVEWLNLHETASFGDSTLFLGEENVKKLSSSLLRLMSKDSLETAVEGWSRWSTHGDSLWDFIQQLQDKYRALVKGNQGKAKTKVSQRSTRRSPSWSASSSSDKENSKPVPTRTLRGQSPSPAYVPRETVTRLGRVSKRKVRPYD